MGSGDAEVDGFDQSGLHRGLREQFQRIMGHGAVMAGAFDGVLDRAVLGHQPHRLVEMRVRGVAGFQSLFPEGAFGIVAAAEGQHDGQSDLALAEIVADILAQFGTGAAVIQRIVDQLEGNAEIGAIAAAG